MTDWYNAGGVPGQGAPGNSLEMRTEFAAIASGISAKLPPLTGNNLEIVRVNAGGTALESISVSALATAINDEVFSEEDGVLSGVSSPVTLTHTVTGTPANGIGTGLDFVTETSVGNNETGLRLAAVATDVTAASEDFDLVAYLMAGGAAVAERFRVKSTGELALITGGFLSIAGNNVLSQTALGSTVLSSSLTSLGTIASLVATTADINGGTIDNTAIGTGTPAIGLFSAIGVSTTSSFGGTITGPSGTWDSGGMDLAASDTYAIDGNDVLSATALGAGVVSSSLTSLGTIASLVATTADINGGTIDNAAVGATTPSTGVFTDLSASGTIDFSGGTVDIGTCTAGTINGVAVADINQIDAGTATGQFPVWNHGNSAWEPTDSIQVNGGAPWIGVAGAVDEGLRFFTLVGGILGLYAGANGDTPGTTSAALSINATTATLNASTGNLNLQAGGSTYLQINSNGRISVNGASTTGVRIAVQSDAGDSVAFRAFDSAGSVVFDAQEDGSCRMPELGTGTGTPLEISGGTIVRDTSSIRFKQDVADYTDALSELMKLRPRIYRRKDTGAVEAGFIAEEVHEAGLEKYVFYEDGAPMSVHYGKITALLASAFQQRFGVGA